MTDPPPFGTTEILAGVDGASSVLDVGCGGGRLTVALAQAGAAVTGIDTSHERLSQARERAARAGVELDLREHDFDEPLPFPDASFGAVVSRLALMAARDPVATLRELARVCEAGGRIVTALWASPDENPWLALPREAVGAALGAERAGFARAFGRLGEPAEAAAVHRAAGFRNVEATVLRELRHGDDTAAYWEALAAENGHFRRVDETLGAGDRSALLLEVERRLAPFARDGRLAVPRALVLVSGRR